MAESSLQSVLTRFWLRNEAGTLEHRFTNVTDNGAVSLSDTPVNLATTIWQPLPDGLTTTPFTAGVKISNAFSDAVIFQTVTQEPGVGGLVATLVYNSTGTDIAPIWGQCTEEVDGVTRRWPLLQLLTVPAGMTFPINTTNIPTGKIIMVDLIGTLLA